jgi:hypothetical protein
VIRTEALTVTELIMKKALGKVHSDRIICQKLLFAHIGLITYQYQIGIYTCWPNSLIVPIFYTTAKILWSCYVMVLFVDKIVSV